MSNIPANLSSVQEKLQERIRSQFVELIPEEVFAAMIEKEIQTFMSKDLPELVKKVAGERVIVLIKAEFAKPEWAETWSGDSHSWQPSELVKKILEDSAPKLVQAMFGNMAAQIVQATRNGQVLY